MSQNNIDVSIIIPVYNAEPYLRDCLDSVLNQNYPGFEVIMVNDGSTDGSCAIMEEYSRADSRFICIDQENQGVGGARNRGIDASEGRYILFLDADDELLDGTLQKIIPFAIKNRLDMVQLKWTRTKSRETAQTEAGGLTDRIVKQKELLEYFVDHLNEFTFIFKIYRAEIIRVNKIRFKTRFCEDILFNMTMVFYCERFYLTGKAYYYYRPHETGLMAGFYDSPDLNKERNRAIIEMLTLPIAFEKNILTSEQKKELRESVIRRGFMRYTRFNSLSFQMLSNEGGIPSDIKIAFWGAGKHSKHYINMLDGMYLKNAVFVDNDPSKQGGSIYGYPIVAPGDILDDKYKGYKHFITSVYVFDIFAQMKELGIVTSFADMRLDVGENKQYDLQLQAADELFDMFCEAERRVKE